MELQDAQDGPIPVEPDVFSLTGRVVNLNVEALDRLGVRKDELPGLLLVFVVYVNPDRVSARILDGSGDAVAREGACVEVGPILGMREAEVAPAASYIYDGQLLLEFAAACVIEDGKE